MTVPRRFDSWTGSVAIFYTTIAFGVVSNLAFDSSSARAQTSAKPAASANGSLLAVEIYLDAKPVGRAELYLRNGSLFATDAQLKQWQLTRRANTPGFRFKDRTWFSLASIPEAEIVHYFAEKRVEIRTSGAVSTAVMDSTSPASPQTLAPAKPAASEKSPANVSKPGAATTAALVPTESGAPRLMPLEVSINGAKTGNWVLLERGGVLYAPAEAFEEWRLNRKADAKEFNFRGQSWFPLTAVPGFQAQLNAADQSMDIKFQAGAFAATRVTQTPTERPKQSPALPAAFLNYDLSYTASDVRGIDTRKDLGALMELGFSGSLGVLTSSHVGRNLTGEDESSNRSFRRLETTFARDFPENNLSLRVGDTATRQGMWGRSTYFGGIQFGRNFALSPGFITQPVPTIAGQSTSPSTVELYINDSLRQTSQVPTGPFVIDNFPLLTGSGQARVVVRDLLGRETVLVQNFFSHSDLLEKGLSDWNVNIGAVRNNLGTENADYGRRFGSGTWRYGISQNVTLETNAEGARRAVGGGLGVSVALPGQLLGQVAGAASDDADIGRGYQWLLGFEHSSLRHGFTARAEGTTRDYRQISADSIFLPYRRQLSASYTYSSERIGHLGIGYARIDSYERGPFETYSANYAHRIGLRSTVSFLATRAIGPTKSDSFAVSLLIPFDRDIIGSANVTNRGSQTDGYISASRALGAESGTGWRVLGGGRADQGYGEAGWYYQGSKGLFTSDFSASEDQKTLRIGGQGGLVAVGGNLFASRRIQDSFALVEVPGYANVGVGFQSSILARTNSEGKALVTRLLPYRSNSLRLDPSELPISAELDTIEQVVVPAARTGVRAAFPVRSGRGALIKIVFDDGLPAPAGAEIELVGDKKEFFVARRGEAFITGLQAKNTVILKWNDHQCRMGVELPPGKVDEIAKLGPFSCKGIAR